MTVVRVALRWLLGLLYAVAAYFHFTNPGTFLTIMPGWVPYPEAVILWTGLAELAGALALVQPWSQPLRRAGAIGLALYAIGVYPANVNHMLLDLAKPDHGWGLAYHIPRQFAQPLLVWLALWAGEVIEWPWRRTR